ncbi:MAG: putative peroxiredoxin bcp [Candidatus Izimaplasma bacterium HR2]|nr:MAG: putative peroxiredoxin bcp [Candidatus Izimaplasma bacterium HR2]
MNMKYLDIKLEASDDSTYSLRDFLGSKVVLYFYPKDNTSGCTVEAKDFTSLQSQYLEKGYKIIGVSRDSVKSHKNFITKQELNLLLLSDINEEMVKAFDVLKEKSMYGRTYMGIVRSTFVLDEEGKIIKEVRKVKVKEHAQILLNEL